MARVTVEDCVDKVESPYELVLVAKERATQLNSGVEPTLDRDNDKNTVISLREIASENIKVPDLIDSAIYKLRKHVEQVDDGSEEDEVIGDDFVEVFLDTPLDVCEDRDPKGLYKKARAGEIKGFTGIDAPYEAPKNPEFTLNNLTIDESVNSLIKYLDGENLLSNIKEINTETTD